MVTKNKLISDIILKVTQGAPSDDLELDDEQVAFWIQNRLNDLVRREIVDEQKNGRMIPPVYIIRNIALALTEEAVTDIAVEDQRFYTDLPQEVLDLPRDGGIVRVLDYEGNLIHKTSVEQLEDTKNLRFAKPSTDNVLYYRESKRVFVVGFNTGDIELNPIMVSMVPRQDILALADTGEVLITDQLLPILIDACVQDAKLQMYGTQPDTDNDGADVKKIQYHTAIANPATQSNQPAQ